MALAKALLLAAAAGAPSFALDATAEAVRAAISDPALYGYSPHNLLLGSSNTVWNGAFTGGQSNVSSVAVPALFAGTIVQLATRGSGGDSNVGSQGITGLTVGLTYTQSCYVWLPSGQTYTQVRMSEDSSLSSPIYRDADLGLRDQWQRISVTGVATSTSSVAALRPTAPAGTILYHTAWQTNVGPTPTAYVATTLTALGPTTPGWLLPGSAGARLNASARSSVAMQVRRDDLLGAELVTNGDFANGTTGWTAFANGSAIAGASGQLQITAPGGSVGLAWQSVATVAGRTYRITYDVAQGTNTQFTVSAGTTAGGNNLATTGAISTFGAARTLVFTATGATTFVNLTTENNGTTVFYDNVSVREVIIPAGGYEFAPHNLATWADDLTNAAWTRAGIASVTPTNDSGSACFVVTEDAGSGGHTITGAGIAIALGATTVYVVEAKANGRNWIAIEHLGLGPGGYAYFDLANGNVGNTSNCTARIESLGSGWYRCMAVQTATAAASATPRIYIASANSTVSYTGTGTLGLLVRRPRYCLGVDASVYVPTTTAAVYAPAIDWLSANVLHGIRSEEARTNSLTNSAMVGASAGANPTNWGMPASNAGCTVTTVGAGTEFGLPYIDVSVVGTAANTFCDFIQIAGASTPAATPGQVWSASTFTRLISGTIPGTLTCTLVESDSGGGYLRQTVANVAGTAFQRTVSTATIGASSAFVRLAIVVTGFAISTAINFTLRIYCPQLEQGTGATSPILTYGSTATRAADVIALTDATWVSPTAGTFICDATRNAASVNHFPVLVRLNGTGSDRVNLGYLTSAGAGWEVWDDNVSQAAMYPTVSADTRRVAGAYAANDFATCVNGGAVSTDTSGTVPSMTAVFLGSVGDGQAVNQLNGHITRVRYAPQRMSNATLQALTA